MKKRSWLVAFGLMLIAPLVMSQVKDYPNKPVRVVVPLAAGSGGDAFARYFAEKVSAILGQPFLVENIPGASGVIGAVAVKKAPADGYTILQGSTAVISTNPVTTKDLPYDPVKDFKPVSGLVRGMSVFIVAENSGVRNVADLVAAAKKAKAPLNVGTFSPAYQLAQEYFASLAGVKFNNVPYKGGGVVVTDVIGGQLDFAVTDLSGAAPLIKSGKVRALAVSGDARHPDFPNVPTVREGGYPDYVIYTWASFYVRSETPDELVTKLSDALQKALATPEAKEFAFKAGGVELMPLTPVAMRKFQLSEQERIRRVAEMAGMTPQ